jgi:tripartite-type tricarboxylate transporter receptor subunit TctC
MFRDVAAGGIAYHQRGDARALAVSADRRLPQVPDVPTLTEGGVVNAESYTWHMVFAPAGTPAPVVQAINAAFNKVAAEESVRRRLTDLTMMLRSDTTPATTRAFLNAEVAKWETVIRNANIRVE